MTLIGIALPCLAGAPADANTKADFSFGHRGVLFTAFGERPTKSLRSTGQLIVERNGKIVLGASAPGGGFMVARLNADGSPDTSFGGDGRIATAIAGASMAVQPNGGIIVAGSVGKGNPGLDIAVARYEANGRPDPSFGRKGIVRLRGGNEDAAEATEVQPNGTIVIVGSSSCHGADRRCDYTYSETVLARFRPNGALRKVRSVGGGGVESLAMGARGQIVVLAASDEEDQGSRLLRLRPNGTVDGSFNGFGLGSLLVGPGGPRKVALQTDDKVLVTVAPFPPDNPRGLYRLRSDGSLDTAFGTDGAAECAPSVKQGPEYDSRSVGVLPDRRLLLSGGFADCGLVRYLADGSADLSFGIGGRVDTRAELGGSPQALAVAPDGAAITLRWDRESGEFRLARYVLDGTPDPAFGARGVASLRRDSPTLDRATAMVSLSGGRVLAAGTARCADRSCGEFALARYRANGKLDRLFGIRGRVTTSPDRVGVGTSVAVGGRGKIVVGGGSGVMDHGELKRERLTLARYRPNGDLDPSFGTGGIVKVPSKPGETVQANAVGIAADGDVIAVGEASCSDRKGCGRRYCSGCGSFFVARFRRNGTLDRRFGKDGAVRIDVGRRKDDHDAARAVAIQPNGRIVVAGRTYRGGFGVLRLLPDGRRDRSFGRRGIVRTRFFVRLRDNDGDFFRISVNRPAMAVALTSRGKIVVAGGTDGGKNHGVVVRYRRNGAIDRGFGKSGSTDLRRLAVKALAVDRCRRLLLAGAFSPRPGIDQFGVTRLLPSGRIDRSFAKRTLHLRPRGREWSVANAIALSRRRLVAAGVASAGAGNEDFALVAFRAPGRCR